MSAPNAARPTRLIAHHGRSLVEAADSAEGWLDNDAYTARMPVKYREAQRTGVVEGRGLVTSCPATEEDGVGNGTKGSGEPGSTEDVSQAVARIRSELGRLSGEIERTATEQFEQRKPELRASMDDLEAAIEALATRAKGFIGDLKAKLDETGPEAARSGRTAAGSVKGEIERPE